VQGQNHTILSFLSLEMEPTDPISVMYRWRTACIVFSRAVSDGEPNRVLFLLLSQLNEARASLEEEIMPKSPVIVDMPPGPIGIPMVERPPERTEPIDHGSTRAYSPSPPPPAPAPAPAPRFKSIMEPREDALPGYQMRIDAIYEQLSIIDGQEQYYPDAARTKQTLLDELGRLVLCYDKINIDFCVLSELPQDEIEMALTLATFVVDSLARARRAGVSSRAVLDRLSDMETISFLLGEEYQSREQRNMLVTPVRETKMEPPASAADKRQRVEQPPAPTPLRPPSAPFSPELESVLYD
jgi:hypothetical protein